MILRSVVPTTCSATHRFDMVWSHQPIQPHTVIGSTWESDFLVRQTGWYQQCSTPGTGRQCYWYGKAVLLVRQGSTTGTVRQYFWYGEAVLLVRQGSTTGMARQYYWYGEAVLLVRHGSTTGTARQYYWHGDCAGFTGTAPS